MQRGLTQVSVAQAVGISQAILSDVEGGMNQSPPTFVKLAQYYGLDIDDLIIDGDREEPVGKRAS